MQHSNCPELRFHSENTGWPKATLSRGCYWGQLCKQVGRSPAELTTNHCSLQRYQPESGPFVPFLPRSPTRQLVSIWCCKPDLCFLWNVMDKICSASTVTLPHIEELVLRLPTILPLYLIPPRLHLWQRLLRPLMPETTLTWPYLTKFSKC